MARPKTSRLHSLPPLRKTLDMRIGYTPPKEADSIYGSFQHQEWRKAVLARAGHRCEQTTNGQRCAKAAPAYRMFADHIVELKDGGTFDLANGQCLCGSHHTTKTVAERDKRLAVVRVHGD